MARILIVEDEHLLGKTIAQALTKHGHEVRTATTGEEGLALAADVSAGPGAVGYEAPPDERHGIFGAGQTPRPRPRHRQHHRLWLDRGKRAGHEARGRRLCAEADRFRGAERAGRRDL